MLQRKWGVLTNGLKNKKRALVKQKLASSKDSERKINFEAPPPHARL